MNYWIWLGNKVCLRYLCEVKVTSYYCCGFVSGCGTCGGGSLGLADTFHLFVLLSFLFKDLRKDEIDIVFASSHEWTLLLWPFDHNVEHACISVCGLSTCLLYQECNWQDLIEKLKPGGVSHRLKHGVDSLAFDENLITIHCKSSWVAEGESLQAVMLKHLEVTWDLVGRFQGCSEQLGFSTDLQIWLGDYPTLSGTHLEKGQLFHLLILGIEQDYGRPTAIHCKCRTFEGSACETIELALALPDGEDWGNREVWVHHCTAINRVKGDCVLSILWV